MPFGRRCRTCSAEQATQTRPRHGPPRRAGRPWIAVSRDHGACSLLGLLGRPPYAHACRGARTDTCNYLSTRSGTTRTVLQRQRTRVAPYRTKAGATAPRGACSSTALAPPHLRRKTGRMAGSKLDHSCQGPAAGRGGGYRTWRMASNFYYRDRVMLPSLTPDRRALLRSQSGPHAGAWLTAIPGEPATTLSPPVMPVAMRRRLRLPCGGSVDAYGDHALACPRTGLFSGGKGHGCG